MATRRDDGGGGESEPDWGSYAGRWVALSGGRVVGVGNTENEAYLAAKGSRPKEEPAALLQVPVRGSGALEAEGAIQRLFARNPLAARAREALLAGATRCYLVGGSVRDALLGREGHDLDFVVDAGALELGRRLADAWGAGYFPLDPERGTARVVAREESGQRAYVDIATLAGGAIERDLGLRDFTLNAMAVDLYDLHLVDPFGGQEDMRRRRLRLVSPAGIAQDPIRALRAARQAAELGLIPDAETERIVARDGEGLTRCAQERIRDELVRILLLSATSEVVSRLEQLGLLQYVLPEVSGLKGLARGAGRRLDAWEHTLLTTARVEQALAMWRGKLRPPAFLEPLMRYAPALLRYEDATLADERPRWVLLKLAALLHEMGQAEPAGDCEAVVQRAGQAATRLRFSAFEAELVALVIRSSRRVWDLAAGGAVTRLDAHRYFRDAGPAGLDGAVLALADGWARTVGVTAQTRALLAVLVALFDYRLSEDSPAMQKPLATGHDLIEHCGFSPGPEIGLWLQRVREQQVMGVLRDKAEALQWVREQAHAQKGS